MGYLIDDSTGRSMGSKHVEIYRSYVRNETRTMNRTLHRRRTCGDICIETL